MTSARLAASIGGATLLAAWLANAAAVPRRAQTIRPPSPQPEAAVLDSLASDVQSQSVRLRQRLAEAPVPATPARNPFAFRRRAASAPAAARPIGGQPVVAPAETPEVEPLLALAGVAEQNTSAGVVRTAIVTGAGDDVYVVSEGQTIAGRYTVIVVTPDVVELKDLMTGATRRLSLR